MFLQKNKKVSKLLAVAVTFAIIIQPLIYCVVSSAKGGTFASAATLITYTAPNPAEVTQPSDSKLKYEWSTLYTVRVRPEGADDSAWQNLQVFKARVHNTGTQEAAFVYFDCDGLVEVEVTLNSTFNGSAVFLGDNSTVINPASKNVIPKYIAGSKVMTFTAEPNQKLVVDPNGDTRHSLQVFANTLLHIPTQEDIPDKTITYVDASKGDTLQWQYDTDVVIVKAGFYNSDFAAKSNQTWYIEGGAVIRGSATLDYTKNAKLIGRGMLYRPTHKAMSFDNCEDAYVEGIIACNYGAGDNGGYFANIANAKNVTLKDTKSISCNKWSDAIDIFTSEDVTIQDCFIRSGDDCIAIYGPRWNGKYWGETGNVRNINVSGCTLMPDKARPINFGTHGDGTSPNGGRVIDNIKIKDIDILTYNIYAKDSDGVTSPVDSIQFNACDGNTITNVFFENIRIQDAAPNRIFKMFISTTSYGSVVIPGRGIDNIYFKDIAYTNPNLDFESPINGYNSSIYTSYIKNVTVENLTVNGEVAASVEDAKIKVGSYVENVKVVKAGETKYSYNPAIVPEDIWADYYDYAQVEGVTVTATSSEKGSDPSYVLDGNDDTIWYSHLGDSEPNNTYSSGGELKGLTIDLGTLRKLSCVRITWEDPNGYKYRIFASKDGTEWGALSDEQENGSLNPKSDTDYKRVKWNWFANQRYALEGRYIKIVPCSGYQLAIAEVAVLGQESYGASVFAASNYVASMPAVSSFAANSLPEISLFANAFEEPDTGAANGITNPAGEWFIYGSKFSQVIPGSSITDITDTNGLVEVTGNARSASLQFDISTRNNNTPATDKVIKNAKLRITPMVSKSNAKHTLYTIDNAFNSADSKKPVAEFTVPRVGGDDFFNQANIKALTTAITSYPTELSNWQTLIDVTGDIITAEDDTLSLHISSSSAATAKVEYATSNIAKNSRLTGGAVPLLYSGGATAFSKWVYPQIVFEYTDDVNYKNAYDDFVQANSELCAGTVTESSGINLSVPAKGSTITLEMYGSGAQPAKIDNRKVVFNTDYVGDLDFANVKLIVTNGSASYTKIISVPVIYTLAHTITFSTAKNTKGEASITSGGKTYTDGTAYAKAGGEFTVNDGANTGYKAKVVVKTTDGVTTVRRNDNGTYTMPDSNVTVTISYEKGIFGSTRIAATNSASVQSNNNVAGASGNITIGSDRLTFLKFDLSNYKDEYVTTATYSFAASSTLNRTTTAIFYVPNNNWTESGGLNATFCLEEGNAATSLNSFGGVNLFDKGNTYLQVAPDAGSSKDDQNIDLSSASKGILKDYFLVSCPVNTTFTYSVSAAIQEALKRSPDNIVTLMIYSPRGTGLDIYSAVSAPSLAQRPSLTITESASVLSDSDLVTEINDISDLEMFAAIVSGGNDYAGKTVTLNNDIDLSTKYNVDADKSWASIGTHDSAVGTQAFAGNFEGNYHTIRGLYIKEKGIAQGLFGAVSGAVNNLTVEGVIDGGSVIGGIAGWSSGDIINCHSFVDITAERGAGGIVGTLSNGGAVLDCSNSGSIEIKDKETYAGGITAHNVGGIIKNSYNAGSITNGSNGFRNRIGGIVGYLDNGTIINCYNTGAVKSEAIYSTYVADKTKNYVGGIVGYSQQGGITDCYNTGTVYNEVDYVGGVAAYLHSRDLVTKCYNTGDVLGESYVGGIVGSNDSVISDCYNTGVVTGTGKYVGGAVGYMSTGNVKNCYNTGNVAGEDNVGGAIGFRAKGTTLSCYYLAGTAEGGVNGEDISYEAEPLITEEFKNTASFINWDFLTIWLMGSDAPALTEYEEPIPTDYFIEYKKYGKAVVTAPVSGEYAVTFISYDKDRSLINHSIQTVTFQTPGNVSVAPVNFNINGAKTVRVMLWNSITDMEPLCVVCEKDLE